LDQRLEFWVKCFSEGKIPSKFPYELRETAKFYKDWEEGAPLEEAMRADAVRIFKRKNAQSDKAKLSAEERGDIEEYLRASVQGSHKSLERLADELLIAQWLDVTRV
jgi:hypothetical protein